VALSGRAAPFADGVKPTASGTNASSGAGPSDRLDRIGLQLYTVRGAMRLSVEDTLEQVARIGYHEVEFAGYFGRSPIRIRDLLRATGLASASAHVPFEAIRRGWLPVLESARAIGHRYVIVAWIPAGERRTLDDWRRVAALYNQAGEAARRAGLLFAYHNHDYEFAPIEDRVPFDLLLEETDPELVRIELDLYWITKGGHDPLRYFARWPGRFPLVHVKDSAGPPEHRMVDVGAGTIPFSRIFARAREAGIHHYFVEHDEPADPFGFCRASYEYLRGLQF
jgi:sugar phosphate isomerase/epimerase